MFFHNGATGYVLMDTPNYVDRKYQTISMQHCIVKFTSRDLVLYNFSADWMYRNFPNKLYSKSGDHDGPPWLRMFLLIWCLS